MAKSKKSTGRLATSGGRLKKTSSGTSSTDTLNSQVSNYKTRLEATGADTDTRDLFEKLFNLPDDQNILFDVFEILGRPQQALFGAIDSAQKGEDIGKGAIEGLTGDKYTYGGQLLRNAGVSDEDIIGDVGLDDILGFGLDVFADPMNIPLFGATKLTKAVKAPVNIAEGAVDASKGLSLVSNASKVGTTAKGINEATKGLTTALETIEEPLKYTTKVSGAQKAFDLIGKGIKGTANVADKAIQKGLSAVDTLQNTKIDNLIKETGATINDSLRLNLLQDYNTLKKQISNVIDYSKALPNNLINRAKQTSGAANFAKRRANEVLDNTVNKARTYAEDLAKKQGRNVDEVFNEVSENITRVLESDLGTSIDGEQWLRNISSKGKQNVISATEDSINEITKVLDQYPSIKYTVKKGERGTELVINTKSSKLLTDFKTNPEVQSAFRNMDLKRSLNYTKEQQDTINALKSNKEFMEVANDTKNAYKKISDIIKEETGVDFSSITDRSGYVRRATDNIKQTNPQLYDYLRNRGLINEKSFSSRKYIDPAEVENVRFSEKIDTELTKKEKRINTLTNQLSENKKRILEEQLENVSAQKDMVAKSLETRSANLSKRQQKAFEQMTNTRNLKNEVKNVLTDKVINKASKMTDTTLSNSLLKTSDNLAIANREYNKIMDQLANTKNMSSKQIDNLLNRASRIDQNIGKLKNKLNADVAKVKGAIEDNTLKILDDSIKAIDKNEELASKLIKQQERYTSILSNRNALEESLTDKLNKLEQAQKNLELSLGSIDASKDTKILKQIENQQKAIDLLKSQQGKQLFDLDAFKGMEDFINQSTKTAEGAKIYNDALLTGTLFDKDIVKTSDDLVNGKVPSNFVRVDVNKLKKQVDSIKGIVPKNSTTLLDFVDSLEGKSLYMDKNLANLFKLSSEGNQTMSPILKMLNSFNNTFKKFKILTPGFQLRNLTGNATNLVLSGVPAQKVPGLYKDASTLLSNADTLIQKANQGLETLSKSELADYNLIRQFYQAGFDKYGTALQDLDEVLASVSASKKGPLKQLIELNGKLNSNIDSLNRMALLKYANENPNFIRNLGKDNAIDAVKYALMDPSNMSDFERNVLKKIIPFYTFTKQNLLFQGSNLLKNTSKYNRLVKAFNSIYGSLDEDEYYQYQKEGFQLPLPWSDDEGNRIYLKTNLPIADLGEFVESPIRRTLSSTTPLIKTPFEMVTGKDIFTGNDINRSTIETLASSLGIDTITTNMWKKVQAIYNRYNGDTSNSEMWAEILRSLAQNVNQENVKKSKAYQELEKYQEMVNKLEKEGIDVPTIKDLTTTSRINLNRLSDKRKRTRNSN